MRSLLNDEYITLLSGDELRVGDKFGLNGRGEYTVLWIGIQHVMVQYADWMRPPNHKQTFDISYFSALYKKYKEPSQTIKDLFL